MKTQNKAEKIMGWYSGTIKLYQRNGKLYARPYLLKPSEVDIWITDSDKLQAADITPRGFGADK